MGQRNLHGTKTAGNIHLDKLFISVISAYLYYPLFLFLYKKNHGIDTTLI